MNRWLQFFVWWGVLDALAGLYWVLPFTPTVTFVAGMSAKQTAGDGTFIMLAISGFWVLGEVLIAWILSSLSPGSLRVLVV